MGMPSPIGIMQGRLTPASEKGPQHFPHGEWQIEFQRALDLGFDTIEWLFELTQYEHNPLWSGEGRRLINQIQRETGIRVSSLCAHYIVQGRPFDPNANRRRHMAALLARIVDYAADIGVERIVVPLVEEASLSLAETVGDIDQLLGQGLRRAEHCNIDLAFETDLSEQGFKEFLDSLSSSRARICFDIGNATAMGQDIVKDGKRLRHLISEIHIKDRYVGGHSVPLGGGDTQFHAFATMLAENDWSLPLVLETPVGSNWHESAQDNLAYARKTFVKQPEPKHNSLTE